MFAVFDVRRCVVVMSYERYKQKQKEVGSKNESMS